MISGRASPSGCAMMTLEQLFMREVRNHLTVDVPLVQEVGVDAAHIAVGLRQGEGLWLCCDRLRLLERPAVLTPQQKRNRLRIRETVVALDEADGVTALAFGVVEPLVAADGDAWVAGGTILSAGANGAFALGAQQRHQIGILRPRLFLRREINKFAHDMSFQIIALSVDNMCFITYNGLQRKRGGCMDYTVEYYEKDDGSRPAEEFILSQDNKMQAKIFAALELLESKGPALREPYSKVLDDGIFEVRAKQGSDISRVLYFFVVGRRAILTNGFVKKTMKTPPREIERAKRYRADFNRKKEA